MNKLLVSSIFTSTLLTLTACIPESTLNNSNAANSATAIGKTTDIADLIRWEVEKEIQEQNRNLNAPSTMPALISIDSCDSGSLEMNLWFGPTWTADVSADNCDLSNSPYTVDGSLHMESTSISTFDAETVEWTTEASYSHAYNFSVYNDAGDQVSGAIDLEVSGSYQSVFNFTQITSNTKSVANGLIYAPQLDTWLKLETLGLDANGDTIPVEVRSEINFSNSTFSFKRLSGHHRLSDQKGNRLDVNYYENSLGVSLNGGNEWTFNI